MRPEEVGLGGSKWARWNCMLLFELQLKASRQTWATSIADGPSSCAKIFGVKHHHILNPEPFDIN